MHDDERFSCLRVLTLCVALSLQLKSEAAEPPTKRPLRFAETATAHSHTVRYPMLLICEHGKSERSDVVSHDV